MKGFSTNIVNLISDNLRDRYQSSFQIIKELLQNADDAKNPTAKQQRLQTRRTEQETDIWRDRYRIRAGIEGTNSAIKRKTGLDRLRVRGALSVDYAILMKIAGWNVLRAACSKKMKGYLPTQASLKKLIRQMPPVGELITASLATFLDSRPSRRAFC